MTRSRRIRAGELTIGGWQLRVTQTPWPMDFPDRKRRGVQWVVDTFGYRHAVDPAPVWRSGGSKFLVVAEGGRPVALQTATAIHSSVVGTIVAPDAGTRFALALH